MVDLVALRGTGRSVGRAAFLLFNVAYRIATSAAANTSASPKTTKTAKGEKAPVFKRPLIPFGYFVLKRCKEVALSDATDIQKFAHDLQTEWNRLSPIDKRVGIDRLDHDCCVYKVHCRALNQCTKTIRPASTATFRHG